jgi:hypothetical protein
LFGHSGRERRGHARIDGIAALGEHPHPGFDLQIVRCTHHFMETADCGEHGPDGVLWQGGRSHENNQDQRQGQQQA